MIMKKCIIRIIIHININKIISNEIKNFKIMKMNRLIGFNINNKNNKDKMKNKKKWIKVIYCKDLKMIMLNK